MMPLKPIPPPPKRVDDEPIVLKAKRSLTTAEMIGIEIEAKKAWPGRRIAILPHDVDLVSGDVVNEIVRDIIQPPDEVLGDVRRRKPLPWLDAQKAFTNEYVDGTVGSPAHTYVEASSLPNWSVTQGRTLTNPSLPDAAWHDWLPITAWFGLVAAAIWLAKAYS